MRLRIRPRRILKGPLTCWVATPTGLRVRPKPMSPRLDKKVQWPRRERGHSFGAPAECYRNIWLYCPSAPLCLTQAPADRAISDPEAAFIPEVLLQKSKIWGRQESARERREEKSAFTDIATRLRSEHSIAWTLTCFFVGRLTALKKLHPPIPRLLQRYRPIAAGEPLHYGRQGSEMD